jgi:putative protease
MEEKVGVISHYFGNISVGVVNLTDGDLQIGDDIHIKGHTTDFTQKVESMQIEHEDKEKVYKGQVVGIKVKQQVRKNDVVYKII